MKKKCILVDIDGTLADISERRKILKETNNWDLFFENILQDRVNNWCLEIISKFKADHSIIVVTGRMSKHSDKTLRWLSNNNVFFTEIFFRKDNDYRSDEVVKEEIYLEKIFPNYKVIFVLDDRARVVKKWRELGLICLQCDEGNF